MSKSEPLKPAIRVNVDVTNPGQFFACCGLLEFSDRLWDGAEGWFDDGRFFVTCEGTLIDVLRMLVAHEAEQVATLGNSLEVKPLIAPLKLSLSGDRPSTFTLDAWMAIKVERGNATAAANPPWNFWSGQQTSYRIWRDLRNALAKQLPAISPHNSEHLFAHQVPLSGRFGFDPRSAWNALDVGFSPNEQNLAVASSPAVELLAAVGIQRFRPQMAEDRQSFSYATWGQPLAPSVAIAAANSAIPVPPTFRFCGRVISRGSYAALGFSSPIRGQGND